jgi:hypothetical protein
MAWRMYLKSSALVTYIIKSLKTRISHRPTPLNVFIARMIQGLRRPEMMATNVLKLESR